MPPPSILIINPNTTLAMTTALQPAIDALGPSPYTITYLTSPPTSGAPASINSPADAEFSTRALIPHLTPSLLSTHAAFLVACYSAHPLVPYLRSQTDKPVLGILEASVLFALGESDGLFGVVSTGAAWGEPLTTAVREFLGGAGEERFVGVMTTGMDADALHGAEAEDVRGRMKGAVKRLLNAEKMEGKGKVRAVCLGCAGMVGLEDMVREACVEELGELEGQRVRVVDGVVAGVVLLEGMLRVRGVR